MAYSYFDTTFHPDELNRIKAKMLNWLKPFGIFVYLDNNQYANGPNRYEVLVAAGVKKHFGCFPPGRLPRWLFGHLSYDMKNTIETGLHSRHDERIGFPESYWFEPETVLYIPHGSSCLCIEGKNPQQIYESLLLTASSFQGTRRQPVSWKLHFSKKEYLDTLRNIQQHIVNGDCYELNFCIEACCTFVKIDPLDTFVRLNAINPAPYACLYRKDNSWLIGASPERFLFKSAHRIYAQPIKGTIGRGCDKAEDDLLKQHLYESIKDRAENIMIVDLMRSDLAKCCIPGSIQATELFGLYAFPQVHQMISTIEGRLRPDAGVADILRSTFPMGSMTGAPKIKVMELIEEYEGSRRGIYSGTVGYINPEGDFDFNVVIRSLMYNSRTRYLAYQTGGAITYDSIPEQEWEEVRLKAKAMEAVFAVR